LAAYVFTMDVLAARLAALAWVAIWLLPL